MALSAADRETLFGTASVTSQMEIYLSRQPECAASVSELRTVFHDLSLGRFHSTLIALRTRGAVEVSGSMVFLVGNKSQEQSKSDKVWKAARIEKTFTTERLSVITELSIATVRHILYAFEKEGLIRAVFREKGKATVYVIVSDSVRRPIRKSRRKGTDSEIIWKHIRSARKDFTVQDLIDKLPLNCKSGYVRMLVRQYRQDGLIELVHAESNPAKHRMYRLTDKGRNTKEAPIVRYETADAVISEVRANGQE